MIEIPYHYTNLRKINKGLTNDNYLIEIDHKDYIVRYPKNDTQHLFKRKQEHAILQNLKDESFVFPILYYDNGIQIVEYYEDLLNFEDYNKSDKIEKVSILMKSLHQKKIDETLIFNPLDQIEKYYQNIKNKPFPLSQYSNLFTKYKQHSFTPVLCHNDWVQGNICYLNEHVYLIDFEYAGMNDAYFDIMSFITENDLSDSEIKKFIMYMFDNNITSKDLEILEMYRDINNVLWYLWALMMYEFRLEPIYQAIAKDKLQALKTSYNTPLEL